MLAITQHSEPKSSRQCKGAVILLINVMILERAPTNVKGFSNTDRRHYLNQIIVISTFL